MLSVPSNHFADRRTELSTRRPCPSLHLSRPSWIGRLRACSPPNIIFVQRNAVLALVVELRGAGGGMRCHLTRAVPQWTSVRQRRLHLFDRLQYAGWQFA